MIDNYKNIAGTICVFGDWFGRPMDNYHKVMSCEEKGNHIRLIFNEEESLDVWDGKGIEINQNKLTIKEASRVRWEWYYYGKPKTIENRFYIEHIVDGDKVVVSSNVNWYAPVFHPSLREPAVSIL
jgi:hypothetical protein